MSYLIPPLQVVVVGPLVTSSRCIVHISSPSGVYENLSTRLVRPGIAVSCTKGVDLCLPAHPCKVLHHQLVLGFLLQPYHEDAEGC